MKLDINSLDTFTRAYLECALWSSTTDDGSPMDDDYSIEDLSPDTVQSAIADCEGFQKAQAELLDKASEEYGFDIGSAGHDFWLTRNGHGAGFFDRGLEETGDQLTEAARKYAQVDLYIGDDGMIYGS